MRNARAPGSLVSKEQLTVSKLKGGHVSSTSKWPAEDVNEG